MYRPTAGLCQRVLQSEIYHLIKGIQHWTLRIRNIGQKNHRYFEYPPESPESPEKWGGEKSNNNRIIKIYVDSVDCKCIALCQWLHESFRQSPRLLIWIIVVSLYL